jgi:hypothetical protein
MRQRWLSRRALLLHALLVTVAPGCLFAGWWQVHRALSGNLVSYFYSIEWPIFAVLAGVAWWQLLHDDERPGLVAPAAAAGEAEEATGHRSWWRRSHDEVLPAPPLQWDKADESPELAAYNDYLKSLAAGGRKKTWGNPRGLPETPAGAR